MKATRRLAVAALACALVAIGAATGALPWPVLLVVCKPLTTLLIVVHAARREGQVPAQRQWVLSGLALSLLGDVALLWPQEGFVPGLVGFLLAHLAYLVAFTRVVPLGARRWPFVAYLALAGAILWQLWPGVPAPLRVPVLAYVVCLSAMAAQAAVVWRVRLYNGDAVRSAVLAVGGALFVASDALLATDRFAGPLRASGLWILATYWLAQWCIASWLRPREFR